jgi:hypothetical protein
MIDSCRAMDRALKYDSVQSFTRDEEYFKLTCPLKRSAWARKTVN